MPKKTKLLTRYCEILTGAGYAQSTIKDYCRWVYRYIIFHDKKLPLELDELP